MEQEGGMMIKLTDMKDSSLMPIFHEKVISNIADDIGKRKEEYIIRTLWELDIDKDILANQVQEIIRLNNLLQEYKDLEEQGLLLRLPCKVGDTVYFIENKRIEDRMMLEFIYDGSLRGKLIPFTPREHTLGEDLFLTREEAEAKLKELEGE